MQSRPMVIDGTTTPVIEAIKARRRRSTAGTKAPAGLAARGATLTGLGVTPTASCPAPHGASPAAPCTL
eukprot:6242826-Prymnesium_polylepis.1